MGHGALQNLTTGHSSVGVGRSALDAVTTQNNNTAVGFYAGVSCITSESVFLGTRAGDTVTTGGDAVFIGFNAGGNVTTGSNNLIIGKDAGVNNVALTTGSKNIIIGANSRTAASNADRGIVIGDNVQNTAATDNQFTIGMDSTTTTITMGGTSWVGSSDVRLKENINDHKLGLDFVKDLRPVTFNWRMKKDIDAELDGYHPTSEIRYNEADDLKSGFVAQEVKETLEKYEVDPNDLEIWSEKFDGTQQLSPGALVPILTKSIQELSSKVEELETKLNGE